MVDRRRLLAAGWVWGLPTVPAFAQLLSQSLPVSRHLSQELSAANRAGQPLVVMVSLAGCSFCHTARRSHLLPLQRAGMPIVQVDMRSDAALNDFQNHVTTHDGMVRRWKVTKAPTLLFFGPGGHELAERMEGAYLPDFYGAYLEDRLSQARVALKR